MKKLLFILLITAIISGCTQPVQKGTDKNDNNGEGGNLSTEEKLTVNIVSTPAELQGIEEEQQALEEIQALATLAEDDSLGNTDDYFK